MYLFVGIAQAVDLVDRAVEFGVNLSAREMLAVDCLEFGNLGAKNGNDVVILSRLVDVADNHSFAYEGIAAKKLLEERRAVFAALIGE